MSIFFCPSFWSRFRTQGIHERVRVVPIRGMAPINAHRSRFRLTAFHSHRHPPGRRVSGKLHESSGGDTNNIMIILVSSATDKKMRGGHNALFQACKSQRGLEP